MNINGHETETTPWIKASRSGDTASCVEMRRHAGLVEVRDTKDRGSGPSLHFGRTEFATWLDSAKDGALDHLI